MTKPAYFGLTLTVLALPLPLLITAGCHKKPVRVTPVPVNCIVLKATDFTKICKPMNATTALCDGVVIHYYCTKTPTEIKQ